MNNRYNNIQMLKDNRARKGETAFMVGMVKNAQAQIRAEAIRQHEEAETIHDPDDGIFAIPDRYLN